VLGGHGPTEGDRCPEDLVSDGLGELRGPRIVAIEDEVRVEVSVAGVAERRDPDAMAVGGRLDRGEVGAANHLRRGARLQRLRQRLHEFVPLGLRAGLALAPWEE